MVVEDLDSPRDIICILIESLGYSAVVGKNSAESALQALKREPKIYGCVLTDMKMPHTSGAELIRLIRKDPQLCHIPVVVLTAFGTADCLVECMKAGASGFLVKPPKKEAMRRELGRASRIISHGLDPRLVKEEDAEALRAVLEAKGMA
jgi:two-component system, chemotaxis family, chemotaxis protein CheY